ncbi:hypothetical protein [Streptomyces lincolnensis]|uniref:hypothetical protein n=1 Tax=Streptomyces lincolnensis TaxID=1915 RepID=UPI0037CED3E1
MAKQNQLSRFDFILFILGAISVTLVAAFIANSFFKGHVGLLLLEAVVYAALVIMYVQTFRTSRTNALVRLSRVISYAGIVAAILIASFISYFIATFRW